MLRAAFGKLQIRERDVAMFGGEKAEYVVVVPR